MAFADLRDLQRELGNPRQLAGGGLDAHDRGQLVAERARIDLGPVAGDHPGPLETLNPLGDGRGRQIHPPAELGERDAAVGRQLADDLTVSSVQLPKIQGSHAHNAVLSSTKTP